MDTSAMIGIVFMSISVCLLFLGIALCFLTKGEYYNEHEVGHMVQKEIKDEVEREEELKRQKEFSNIIMQESEGGDKMEVCPVNFMGEEVCSVEPPKEEKKPRRKGPIFAD